MARSPRVTVLAGGVGAARFLRGLVPLLDPARVTVVVNTTDDESFFGLHVSPDLDTITYTLAGAAHRGRGWGLEGDTFDCLKALGRFYGETWFQLGDRDLATHVFRSERLRAGQSLTQVTSDIAKAFGVKCRILPMSNDPVRTRIDIRGAGTLHFQDYLVKRRSRGVVEKIRLEGIGRARPAPGVLSALRRSDAIIIPPSNPFVSILPIVRLRGVRQGDARIESPDRRDQSPDRRRTDQGTAGPNVVRNRTRGVERWCGSPLPRSQFCVRARRNRRGARREDRRSRYASGRDRHAHEDAAARACAGHQGIARARSMIRDQDEVSSPDGD